MPFNPDDTSARLHAHLTSIHDIKGTLVKLDDEELTEDGVKTRDAVVRSLEQAIHHIRQADLYLDEVV